MLRSDLTFCDCRQGSPRAFADFIVFVPSTNGGTASARLVVVDRNDPKGIDERSYRLFRDVLTFVDTIQTETKTKPIIEQLVDAAGSIGSNREEALGASSRKEFIRFNEIALRSANETVRWLRSCAAKRLGSQEKCVALLDEARQLARILGRIVVTSKQRAGLPLSNRKPHT
jgi:four helix bundle protein